MSQSELLEVRYGKILHTYRVVGGLICVFREKGYYFSTSRGCHLKIILASKIWRNHNNHKDFSSKLSC